MKSSIDYRDVLERDFPDELKMLLGSVIKREYVRTASYMDDSEISSDYALHLAPQARHYQIQSQTVESLRCIPGVTARVIRHAKGNEHYTVVESKSFYLTISMVKSRGRLPRRTQFRTSNAMVNSLLTGIADADDNMLYAILTHVPSRDNRRLENLDLIIPDSRYRAAEMSFDWLPLLSFQDMDAPDLSVPSENIEPPVLRFREESKKKVEGA